MIDYILRGFSSYEQIVNKEIHYIYKKNDKYHEIILKAKKNGFMHLCGLNYRDPKTNKVVQPSHFYSLVKSKKISPSHLVEKKDGTTILKLKVIENLKDLLTANIGIIDNQVTFSNLNFDKAIRSRKQIFALTLTEEKKGTGIYVPVSLLNLKTDKSNSVKTIYEVHCIFSKSRNEEDFYYYESEEYKEYKQNKTQ